MNIFNVFGMLMYTLGVIIITWSIHNDFNDIEHDKKFVITFIIGEFIIPLLCYSVYETLIILDLQLIEIVKIIIRTPIWFGFTILCIINNYYKSTHSGN